MAGRKPLPDKLKVIRGTNQRCRMSKNSMEVEQVTKIPPAPTWMSKTGRKIYKDTASELAKAGLLQKIGLSILLSYCNMMSRHIEAELKIKETKAVIPVRDDKGNVRGIAVSPWHRISIDALNAARSIAAEYGMTPSSQSRIIAPFLGKEKNENDQFFD